MKTSNNKNTSKTSINNNGTIKGGLQQTPEGGGSSLPVHATSYTPHDSSGGGISADSKEMRTIRSLQLRLSGQLQTIRVLEGQLGESNSLLEARTKQLSLAEGRLKQMQLSMDNITKSLDGTGGTSNGGSPSGGGIPGSAASASKLLREVCVLLQYYLQYCPLYMNPPTITF